MKPVVIAVIGGKKSGKTTTIEILTKELAGRGYKIATVKHVPEANFTIDSEGKDTWKFAQAGAKTIVVASSNEIATIEKVDATGLPLRSVLKRCGENDVIFVEGFRKLTSRNERIPKIVIVKSEEEAFKAMKNFKPIAVFAGPYLARSPGLEIPCVDPLKNPEKIADIVERSIKEKKH